MSNVSAFKKVNKVLEINKKVICTVLCMEIKHQQNNTQNKQWQKIHYSDRSQQHAVSVFLNALDLTSHQFTVIILLCQQHDYIYIFVIVFYGSSCPVMRKRQVVAAQTHIVIALFIRLQHLTISNTCDFYTHSDSGTIAPTATCTYINLHLSMTDSRFCHVIVYLPDTIDLTELDGSL